MIDTIRNFDRAVKLFVVKTIIINAKELERLKNKSFSEEELNSIAQEAFLLYQSEQFQQAYQPYASDDPISCLAYVIIAQKYTTPVLHSISEKYQATVEKDELLKAQREADDFFRQFVEQAPRQCQTNCIKPLTIELSKKVEPAIRRFFQEKRAQAEAASTRPQQTWCTIL